MPISNPPRTLPTPAPLSLSPAPHNGVQELSAPVFINVDPYSTKESGLAWEAVLAAREAKIASDAYRAEVAAIARFEEIMLKLADTTAAPQIVAIRGANFATSPNECTLLLKFLKPAFRFDKKQKPSKSGKVKL